MLNESIKEKQPECSINTSAYTTYQHSAEQQRLQQRGWKLYSLQPTAVHLEDGGGNNSRNYSREVMQSEVQGWKRMHLWVIKREIYSIVMEEKIQGGTENGRKKCLGVWRWWQPAEGRENTKWERRADGALSLFTEWHHITTKFNLISTKLRQIHLDTASKKSWRARRGIFIAVKEKVVPLISSSGSPQPQIGACDETLWRLLSKQEEEEEEEEGLMRWRFRQPDEAESHRWHNKY